MSRFRQAADAGIRFIQFTAIYKVIVDHVVSLTIVRRAVGYCAAAGVARGAQSPAVAALVARRLSLIPSPPL